MNEKDRAVESIRDVLHPFLSQKANSKIAENIQNATTKVLNSLQSDKLISNYSCTSVKTTHEKKKPLGRLVDWLKWKTPIVFVVNRPKLIKTTLKDELLFLQKYSDSNLKIDENTLNALGYLTVYKTEWPKNPYENYEVDISLQLSRPLEYIKCDFEVKQ